MYDGNCYMLICCLYFCGIIWETQVIHFMEEWKPLMLSLIQSCNIDTSEWIFVYLEVEENFQKI